MTEKASFDIEKLNEMYDRLFLISFYNSMKFSSPRGVLSIIYVLDCEKQRLKAIIPQNGYYLNKIIEDATKESIDTSKNYILKITEVTFPKNQSTENDDEVAILKGSLRNTALLKSNKDVETLTQQESLDKKVTVYVTDEPEQLISTGVDWNLI